MKSSVATMADLPKTTAQDIAMALFLGRFHPGTDSDSQAFAGCEGDLWVWDPSDEEMVVIDDSPDGMRIELHACVPELSSWFVNLVTREITEA